MRKLVGISLIGIFSLLNPSTSISAVNLPWSTTYNCPEWKQTDSHYTNCDGLTHYGDWKTSDGKEEQITTAANYAGGGAGRGQRHWLGDGSANNSGGIRIEFTSPQQELWIRWYMRFQTGFTWSSLQNFKILYINVGQPSAVVIRFYSWDRMNVASNCPPQNYPSPQGTGWNSFIAANGALDANGNRKSDGQWNMYEVHIKMDTNGSDGIAEMWIDGVRILSYSNVCFGTQGGWFTIVIGSNHAYSANGSAAYYVDYDDIVISTTEPIGPLLPIDKK
ncbi:MAG: hypothetical protein WA240_11820 [Nitrospirota bacterium]